jgi:putative transposase
MPEHFHLLMSEPQNGDPSKVMQVVKQIYAQNVIPRTRQRRSRETGLFAGATKSVNVWQPRFYDFNVWTDHKRIEKLRYMHRNPVKRGLVDAPELWAWSSFRDYLDGQTGIVRVNDTDIMTMRIKASSA